MTDLDKFITLYAELGIELHPQKLGEHTYYPNNTGYVVELRAGSGFEGYPGFVSLVYFDEQGKFMEQGFWE